MKNFAIKSNFIRLISERRINSLHQVTRLSEIIKTKIIIQNHQTSPLKCANSLFTHCEDLPKYRRVASLFADINKSKAEEFPQLRAVNATLFDQVVLIPETPEQKVCHLDNYLKAGDGSSACNLLPSVKNQLIEEALKVSGIFHNVIDLVEFGIGYAEVSSDGESAVYMMTGKEYKNYKRMHNQKTSELLKYKNSEFLLIFVDKDGEIVREERAPTAEDYYDSRWRVILDKVISKAKFIKNIALFIPTWSPSGTYLCVNRQNNPQTTWLISSADGTRTRIEAPEPVLGPAMSEDDQTIAMLSLCRKKIFVANANSGEIVNTILFKKPVYAPSEHYQDIIVVPARDYNKVWLIDLKKNKIDHYRMPEKTYQSVSKYGLIYNLSFRDESTVYIRNLDGNKVVNNTKEIDKIKLPFRCDVPITEVFDNNIAFRSRENPCLFILTDPYLEIVKYIELPEETIDPFQIPNTSFIAFLSKENPSENCWLFNRDTGELIA